MRPPPRIHAGLGLQHTPVRMPAARLPARQARASTRFSSSTRCPTGSCPRREPPAPWRRCRSRRDRFQCRRRAPGRHRSHGAGARRAARTCTVTSMPTRRSSTALESVSSTSTPTPGGRRLSTRATCSGISSKRRSGAGAGLARWKARGGHSNRRIWRPSPAWSPRRWPRARSSPLRGTSGSAASSRIAGRRRGILLEWCEGAADAALTMLART